MLRIDLLGPFQATLAERPFLNFGTIRGQALLIYLAVEGERAHQREKLMALLWPDMPLKSAQQNLRQTLYLLRKQVPDVGNGETLFLTTRQTIQLNPAYPTSVDVRKFNEMIKAGTIAGRQQATDLYRGDFLADFFLADSELYEAWAADRRAEYGRLALDAFDTLAAHYLEISDFAGMEKIARRTLLVDDLHEPAHQQLMKALAGRERQQSAVAHYETFRQQLVEELAVEPNAQTQQLAAQIRQGQAAVERTSVGEPTREPSTAVEDDRLDLSRRTNLLAPTKPLIGRDAELNELDQFFTARGVRLVTITGPGGMGKTRLSIAWALRQADSQPDLQTLYPDGRYFVDLAPITSSEQVGPALAIFLETHGHFPTGRRIFEILVDHLHERLAEGKAVGQEEGKKVRLSAKAMAWQSTFEHNPDTAENLLKRSLALLVPDLHGDTSLSKEEGIAERAFTHYRLGRFLQESQLERSIHHFEKGLVLYRELGDEWGIGHCLQGLGNAYIFISFKTSQRYFDEAIQVFEKSGEKRGLAQALGWLVVSTSLQDDVGKVEGMNRRYQALITSLGDAVMPESTLEMNAVTSEALGQHAQAVAYREQYMSLLRELGRDITIRQIYLGIEYLHNDQFEKGREQLEHSLAQFQEDRAKNHDRMGFCLHVLAMLALAEDEYEQAENLFQQAREIYEHTNNQLDMAGALILTGRTKIGKGELDTAQPYLLAGLQMAYDYNGFIPLIEAFLGVALYLVHQGSYIQARAYYELAWRYPRFNQSALYDAVYAREIRMLTDTIEADTLQSIQQRSLELDPWQEAAALLEELIGLDW